MAHRFALCTILAKYDGPAAWYFLTIPKKESAEIKSLQAQKPRKGWGVGAGARRDWQDDVGHIYFSR